MKQHNLFIIYFFTATAIGLFLGGSFSAEASNLARYIGYQPRYAYPYSFSYVFPTYPGPTYIVPRPSPGYGVVPSRYVYPFATRPYSRGCSPQAEQTTVSVAESVLNELAASPQFESAYRFRQFVAATNGLSNVGDKLNAYLSTVGVDSRNATAIAEFIGARDHSSYIALAQRNMDLTSEQAEILVSRFSIAAMSVIGQ